MRVAESIVIFAPMRHVGCRSACSTVTPSSAGRDHPRKGPPDAVSTRRRTSRGAAPARHWKSALCSESTGKRRTPCSRAARVIRAPAITSVSLLASAMVRPARIAASVGTSPAAPTSAETTMSAGTSAARVARPSGPPSSSGRGEGSSRARRSTAARSSRATADGRWARTSSATRATSEPRAASPPTRNWSGKAAISSSVRRPIDPVAPSTVTVFTWVIAPQSTAGTSRRSVGSRPQCSGK